MLEHWWVSSTKASLLGRSYLTSSMADETSLFITILLKGDLASDGFFWPFEFPFFNSRSNFIIYFFFYPWIWGASECILFLLSSLVTFSTFFLNSLSSPLASQGLRIPYESSLSLECCWEVFLRGIATGRLTWDITLFFLNFWQRSLKF